MKVFDKLVNFFDKSESKAAAFTIGTCLILDAFTTGGLATMALGASTLSSDKIIDALKQPIGSMFSKSFSDAEALSEAEKNHTNPILFAKASEKCIELAKQKLLEDFGWVSKNKTLQRLFKNDERKLEKYILVPIFQKLNESGFVHKIFEKNQQLEPSLFLDKMLETSIDFDSQELRPYKKDKELILGTLTQTFKESFTEQFKIAVTQNPQLKDSYHTHILHCILNGLDNFMQKNSDEHQQILKLTRQILKNQGYVKNIEQQLTEPPSYPIDFLGREKDMGKLREKLLAGDNILLLVNGQGGIGKTTLAAKYYHDFKDNYKHLAWVLNEGDIKTALLFLRQGLGFNEMELKMPIEEQFGLLQTKLANLDKPCLLVIDNVNTPEVLEKQILTLQRLKGFHLLLTSRITEFFGVETLRIEGLQEKDALTLFKTHYPDHDPNEDKLLKQLIANVDRNTLVIELLAKNLNEVNALEKEYSLQQLANDLQQSLVKLSKSEHVATVYHAKKDMLRTEKPEDIIMAMYELRKLSEGEKHLISIFAVLPNEPIPYTFLKDYCNYSSLKTDLKSLAKKGWLDLDKKEKHFKANQVIQDVVLTKQKMRLFDDCKELVEKIATLIDDQNALHIEQFVETQRLVGYAISLALKLNIKNESMALLFQAMGNYNDKTGDLANTLHFYKKMSEIYDTLSATNLENTYYKNWLAISYSKLGDTHTAMGKLDKALEYFQDETTLFAELYEAYPNNVSFKNGLAISYEKLGDTHTAMGKLDKALEYFQERSRLGKELYEAYPNNVSFKNGLAISYEKLGDTHTAMGKLDKALEYFQERSRLGKELYEAYPNNVSFKNGLAISYEKLGDTHTAMGKLDKALEYFQERSRLGKELYEAYPNNVSFKNGLAISYSKLGDTHTAMGKLDKALEYFQERSRLGKELYEAYPNNVSFKNGLAISYSKLGDTHTAMGKLDKALEYFQERSRLGKELYEAYPNNVSFKNGLAISYEKLGDTHTAMGKLDKALEYFQERSRLGKELYEAYPNNVSFKNGLAISYSKLGDTHTAMGKLDKALEYFELDVKLTKELYEAYPNNVSFKNGLAISYSKLGDTHTAMGKLDKALEYFQERSRLGKELYEAYPNNVSFKNGLAISYEKLGSTHTAMGKLDKALEYFQERSRLGKELYEAYPNNVSFKNGLAISYEKLGDTHTAMGKLDKALEYFQERSRLGKELYEAYPNNVSFKNGLAISYSKLGTFYRDHTKNKAVAKEYFEKAKVLWGKLTVSFPGYVEFKRNLNWVNDALKNLEH